MQYLFYILAIPFVYSNYKIIASDLKNKIIPNKYLWYLLCLVPLYYIHIFFFFPEVNFFLLLSQIIFTFLTSFVLYSFWIWAAWDAKYLLVLSLFIPYVWIIPFIGNIALLIITYLLSYFIYFYFGKLVFNKKYRKTLYSSIKNDFKGKWEVYKNNRWGATYKIVLKFLLVFLIIFVTIRLSRIYIFKSILENQSNTLLLKELIEKYNVYILFVWIIVFILWLYVLNIIIHKLKRFFSKKLKVNTDLIWNIFLLILAWILTSFISYELYNNYQQITQLLAKIFSLYLAVFLIIKSLIYSYRITFWIGETEYLYIDNLRKWDIVDKNFLITILWDQRVLWAHKNKKWILYPSPKKFFQTIKNPLSWTKAQKIIKLINIVNTYYEKNPDENVTQITNVKILKTISFAHYILIWFIISSIYDDEIIKYITKAIQKYTEGLFSI